MLFSTFAATCPTAVSTRDVAVNDVGPVDVIVVFLLLAESIISTCEDIIVCVNASGFVPAATIDSTTLTSPSRPSLF
jgi:hypothetical protein